jgi:hypothetical protein
VSTAFTGAHFFGAVKFSKTGNEVFFNVFQEKPVGFKFSVAIFTKPKQPVG